MNPFAKVIIVALLLLIGILASVHIAEALRKRRKLRERSREG